MFGNGLSSIICNAVRAITLIAFPYDTNNITPEAKHNAYLSAIVFCTFGSGLLGLSIIIQLFVLRKNKFYIYHFDWIKAREEREKDA